MRLFLFSLISFISLSLVGQSDPLKEAKELIRNYRFQEASVLIERKLLDSPDDQDLMFLLAETYERTGQQTAAFKLYEQLYKSDSTNTEILMRLGKLSAKMRNLNAAYSYFNRLTEIEPQNPYFHKMAGEVAEKNPLRLGEAIGYYQKALNLNPEDQETGAALANLYLKLNQLPSAKAITTRFLKRDSTNLIMLLLDTRLSYLQQNFPVVLKNAERMIRQGDSIPSALRMYGIALYQMERYLEAIKWLEYLEKAAPSEQAYFYLSMSHYRTGEYAKAEKYMTKAIAETQSPNLGDFYTQLGLLYELQEKYPEAIRTYKDAYALTGNNNLMYRLAHISDQYYKDDKIAEGYFRKFLDLTDTTQTPQRVYSEQRLSEMQKVRFFKTDTL